MTQKTTILWLKIASGVLIAFGLSGLLGAMEATSAYSNFMADLAFFPLDGAPESNAPETRLLWAIVGGLMTGWGLMLWQVATRLYPAEPALARQLILTGIVAWFVIDSTGSVLAGAPMNAVFNIGFLLLFAVPIFRSRRLKTNEMQKA